MPQHPHILANPPKRKPVSGTRTYTITQQTTITGIAPPVNTLIAYTLEITQITNTFRFKKTNTVIDNQPLPNTITELYLTATKPLNTVAFRCNTYGTVKDLNNYKQLTKQWAPIKNQVTKEFKGASVDQMVNRLDHTYGNKQNIIKRLNSNSVLQAFYRSFLDDDYLVYEGRTNTAFSYKGLLGDLALAFKGKKTMHLKDKDLHLQTQANLNTGHTNMAEVQSYFENNLKTNTPQTINATIHDDTLLDYNTLWIKQHTATKIIETEDYKKELTLIMMNEEPTANSQ